MYSDPTYEAWKLLLRCPQKGHLAYSDPTYEAWKLLSPSKQL